MQFLYPNVLFFMLLPLGLLIFLLATNKDSMQQNFSKEVLHKLSISNKHLSKTTRNVLLFTAVILMTIALARPVMNEKERVLEQEVIPLVVAIDVSRSMSAQDLKPNRLTVAKQKLLSLLKTTHDSALGVVLFAKSAYILSPITQDFNSLGYLIKNFDQGYNFDNGSNLLSALEASNRLLKNYSQKNIILLTDGGNSEEFEQEIKYAKSNDLRVYTLLLSLDKPVPIPHEQGYLTNDKGHIITLTKNDQIKNLSLQTQGAYIEYSLLDSDITAIYSHLQQQSTKTKIESKKYKEYTELFYLPLGLALLLLLLAFSSLPRKAVVVSLLVFITQENHASLLDFQTIKEANKAYESKDYDKASKAFSQLRNSAEGQYNHANALYKNKKYEAAIKSYKKLQTQNRNLDFNRLYNMGNSYAKLNQLQQAKEAYEKALKIKDDNQAKDNLKAVNEALQKQKQQSKKNKQDQNQDSKQQDQQNSDQNDKKEQNQQQDNKESEASQKSEQKDQNQKEKRAKSQESQDQSETKPSTHQAQNKKQAIKSEEISEKEAEKWMKQINTQNPNVLLKALPSKQTSKGSQKPY